VELDPRHCEFLRDRFRDDQHVSIVQADFLRFGLPSSPYKVVGNIPFGRTSAILRRLFHASSPLNDALLVLQREAAHRFSGSPHAPESLPSLLIKPEWQVEIVRHLRRADFEPPPHVETSVVWIARRIRPLVHATELDRYQRFVQSSFGKGGNTIVKCLRSVFTHTEMRRLGTDLRFRLDAPPSALTFDQWLGLFRFHVLR
jgi:23S rRNA (adenine-N6)-dimethyltransferase